MGVTIQRVQRGDTYAGYTDLEVMCCPICGVLYAAPEKMLDEARKDPGIGWCCINGHSLHFPGKTPDQKVKEARDALARERAHHDQTHARLIAQKGATTRVRNEKARLIGRVANGVCPCCNRTFKQLARHMAAKHPDYLDDTPVTA
jgi:hypothetical protein